MTENQTHANGISTASERTRAKSRRGFLVAVLVIIVTATAIHFAPKSNLPKYFARDAETTASIAANRYNDGMHALKRGDFNAAKRFFDQASFLGDARGNFGIACMLYQREPNISLYFDGSVGLKRDFAIDHLDYAAKHGVYGAQAALLGYMGGTGSPEIKSLMSSLLRAANSRAITSLDDPALPEFNLEERMGTSPKTVLSKMLEQGLCAPPVPSWIADSLIKDALSAPMKP
jgi:hypothetical protein